jgi:hypothetical protein
MKIIKLEDDCALVQRRFWWRKNHLWLYSSNSKTWYRDKLFGSGVKLVGPNQELTNELVRLLDLILIEQKLVTLH